MEDTTKSDDRHAQIETCRRELAARSEQLRRTTGALDEARSELTDLYEFAPVGYATLDSDGRVRRANLATAAMLGLERDAMIGRRFSSWVHPGHQTAFLRFLHPILPMSNAEQLELQLDSAQNATVWVRIRSQPVLDAKGSLREYRMMIWDISTIKTAEKRLTDLNRTLEQRVAERSALAERRSGQLQQLAVELARTEERERRALAKSLHDNLQQLMAAAKAKLADLKTQINDRRHEPAIAAIAGLLDETLQALQTLSLDLSPPILQSAGLPAALDWLASWMQEKYGLQVTTFLDRDLDPGSEELRSMLFSAARGLLDNVRRHAGVSRTDLVLKRRGDLLVLSVSDQGAGFDPTLLEIERPEGFGLVTIRERIAAYGGRLAIESAASGGTTATLEMPIHRLSLENRRAEDAAGEPMGAMTMPATAPRVRILLADDHQVVRRSLATIIADEPDFEVVGEASDGQEALELARRLTPDVIVMDVSMPRLNGIEATRMIKSELPNVRVIGLSMHKERDVEQRLKSAGAEAYITKGGRLEDLILAIRGKQEA